MTEKVSRTTKLWTAFRKGAKLSEKQIRARFDLVNPTAQIARLRQEGNEIVNQDGKYFIPRDA